MEFSALCINVMIGLISLGSFIVASLPRMSTPYSARPLADIVIQILRYNTFTPFDRL